MVSRSLATNIVDKINYMRGSDEELKIGGGWVELGAACIQKDSQLCRIPR
jgi:hypothetical protein